MAKKVDVTDVSEFTMSKLRKIPFGEKGWEKENSDLNKWYPEGESLTEQAHADSCDINVMMARYEKAGVVPRTKDGQMFFGDFSHVGDYHSALNAVNDAMDSFMQLPAKVRARFDNDPGQMLKFLEDPSNREEGISLGIIDKPAEAPPSAAPVKEKAP